jgi:hypothetical protein
MPRKEKISDQNIHDITWEYAKLVGPMKVQQLGLDGKQQPIPVKGFEGPLPDNVGYRQHAGECASDALQEIFMFADEFREYTQPIVYGLTQDQMELSSNRLLSYMDLKRFRNYFIFLQKRFRVHYDVLNLLRKKGIKGKKYIEDLDEVCLLDPLFGQKERLSPVAGILALKRVKEQLVYTGGFPLPLILKTYETMFRWFGLPFRVQEGLSNVSPRPITYEMIGYNDHISKVYEKPKMSRAHATAFMKMNGEWVHYDDNFGFLKASQEIIDTLHEHRLTYIDVLTTVALKDRNRYFCKTTRPYDPETMTSYPTIEAIWVNNKWSNPAIVQNRDGSLLHNAPVFWIVPKWTVCIYATDKPSYKTKVADVNTVEEFNDQMQTFKDLIYKQKTSNSALFEDMYRFATEHFDLLQQSPEFLRMIGISIQTVTQRTACTPMTHYWVFELRKRLQNMSLQLGSWFENPEALYRLKDYVPLPSANRRILEKRRQQEEEIAKRQDEEAKRKKAEEDKKQIEEIVKKVEKLSPCPKGQVRNAVTRRCRDRTEEETKKVEVRKEMLEKKREEVKAAKERGNVTVTQRAKKEPKKPKVYVL